MKKKGFTLIELLAVIVILAIIALIATPIVLNIINETKESATFRSADFYVDGVKTAVATSILQNKQVNDGTYSIMKDGNICLGEYDAEKAACTGDRLEIQIDGEKPTSGTITIKDGQINKVILNISDKELVMNSNGQFDYYLAPGIYDENDNLLASWDELVEEYDIKNAIEEGGVTDLREYYNAFKLVIDDSVTKIGEMAFIDCWNLISVTIPSSVTSIGAEAFLGCIDLTEIIIPNSVISIGTHAFNDCSSLTSISIPSSVTSIGEMAFYDCDILTTIYYNGTATGAPWDAPNATVITDF